MTKARNIAEFADDLSVSNGEVSIADLKPSQSMMFRNRIINGDMRIDQRNAGSAVTTASSFPVDRFQVLHITDGAFSAQQNSSAPSGFTNSIEWTTTTADASLAATQHALVRQRVEGLNISDLGFGTTSAKTITLSFWVKSSLTGTFGGSLMNNGQTRGYPYSYTINTADTWEHKKITIQGDTNTGITWLTSNGIGFELFWSMGVGSDYDGTAGAWTSTPYQYSVTGAVSVMGTLNANWSLTGVQLEEGPVATPFEHRPYGLELSLCQRYFEKSYNIEDTPGTSTYNGIHTNGGYYNMPAANYGTRPHASYKITKRGSTTVKTYDSAGNLGKCNYPDSVTNQSFTVIHSGQSGFSAETSTLSGGTDGRCYWQWTAESEL